MFFALFFIFYRNPGQDKRLTYAEAQYIKNGGGEPETPAGEIPQGPGFAFLLRQPKVWGLTLGFSAYDYLFALLLTWLPSYLTSTFSINILSAGGYALLIWGVATLSDLIIGGWLVELITRGADADRVRKTLFIAGLVIGFAVIGAAYTKDVHVAVFLDDRRRGGDRLPRARCVVDSRPDRAAQQHRTDRRHHESVR